MLLRLRLTIFLLLISLVGLRAQELTRIFGTVKDKETGEALPFVNISFAGTTIGTVSNSDGDFYLESEEATSQLKGSFIGFKPQFKTVKIGQSQTIGFTLSQTSLQLENVTVRGKKLRYRNKNNPAVDLIKKIVDNKSKNRAQNLEYYEYDQYEKVEFDFNNITDKFRNRKYLKNFQMIFDYVDTSEVNGKTYLPIFLRETSSKVYYRKSPKREVEYRQGQKMTGFADYFDNQGVSFIIDKMYQKVDIYDNNIDVLTQKFVSPISGIAPITYKYYIADTLEIDGEKFFKLSFQPRNENNLAFVGNLFVTTDSTYAVKKVSMRISKKINLNYVEDLFIDQEFEKTESGSWVIQTDKISIDFNLLSKDGLGMFGKRTVSFKDRKYNIKREDEIYAGVENVIQEDEVTQQGEEFWTEARHMDLSRSEQGVYSMVEEVEDLPAFKRMMDLLMLILVGYKDFGPYDLGPINTFYSWNDVEGFRMRFGGKTNLKFSKKWQLEGYGAYGFKDQEFKYSAIATYFFDDNPLDALRFTYQKEANNPGEDLMFVMEDNFLLSFKRGANNRRVYNKQYSAEYLKELDNGWSFNVGVASLNQQPGGILNFDPDPGPITNEFISKSDRKAQEIETSEIRTQVRFAPNEQYYQGKRFRIPIYNKYPVFTMSYTKGINNLLDSDYGFDKLGVGIFKRTYTPPFGYFDLEVEGTKIWGSLPYALLNIPRANQTFSYQLRSYNLMNFVEFVSDRFVSVNYAHYFNGYLLNKVPFLKALKLRSIITVKALFGDLSDRNNPEINTVLPDLPLNIDGSPGTSGLTSKPYLETSIGVGNIFKFFRIDLVKRWTYLNDANGDPIPGVARGYNIRGRFKIEF